MNRLASLWVFVLAACSAPKQVVVPTSDQLELVATFGDEQATGVAVSATGRVFVNFPLWGATVKHSVIELKPDGSQVPYPSAEWNTPGPVNERFVCVQAVWVDSADHLWIVDPANPRFGGIVAGGPKLVEVDLATDQVVRVIRFDESVTHQASYLNDVRVDAERTTAYLTDSGTGAILVVDLATNTIARRLEHHPSVRAEAVKPKIGGKPWKTDAGVPQIHSDGLALSKDGAHLFFLPLTGRTLYRVSTAWLKSGEGESDVRAVAGLGSTADGIETGPDGALYLTALERDAVVRFDGAIVREVVQDPRLLWPDSLAFAKDGSLYITASQIHLSPSFNGGKSARTSPYQLWRLRR